jgi:hypothetical protein
MENLIYIFFVKSYEWNFSQGNKMIQSTHIQHMYKYFMKFSNRSRMIFEIYLHLVKHHIFTNNF